MIIIPNTFHTIHLSTSSCFIGCVTSCLEQHSRITKFNQVWAMIPPCHWIAWFNKPCHRATQCGDEEIAVYRCVIVPVYLATRSNPLASWRISITEALCCIPNSVYVHCVAQYQYHTEATFEYMEHYQEEFHNEKDVFSWFCTRTSAKNVSVKLIMQHTVEKQK